MAVVTTTFTNTDGTLPVQNRPLQGMSSIPRERSDVPRQVLEFGIRGGDIALTGAGDTQNLSITIVLPRNYSYVLMDASVAISTAAAGTNNFPNVGRRQLSDAVAQADRFYNDNVEMISNGAWSLVNNREEKIYAPAAQDGTHVLYPRVSTNQAQVALQFHNETEADAAYKVDAYARFLVYDISQASHWAVNTPQPVR